jgi:hypothetical protein
MVKVGYGVSPLPREEGYGALISGGLLCSARNEESTAIRQYSLRQFASPRAACASPWDWLAETHLHRHAGAVQQARHSLCYEYYRGQHRSWAMLYS